jgi:hypothetical protein
MLKFMDRTKAERYAEARKTAMVGLGIALAGLALVPWTIAPSLLGIALFAVGRYGVVVLGR